MRRSRSAHFDFAPHTVENHPTNQEREFARVVTEFFVLLKTEPLWLKVIAKSAGNKRSDAMTVAVVWFVKVNAPLVSMYSAKTAKGGVLANLTTKAVPALELHS